MARNVLIDIKARTSQYERAIKRATKDTGDFNSKLGKIGKGAALGGIAAVATGIIAIGAAAVKVGIESATAFAGFEKSLSQIEGLVGVAHEEVMGFKDGIKDLAIESARGPQELADALFFITSAGLEGQAAMDALEVSAKAAAAGLGETATIADVVTSAMNAYGDNIGGAAEATDVLVAAVREGKAAAPELAGSLGRVIPIASQMGVTFDEVGAAIAAMTRIGLNAAESSTALRSILNSLLAPTTDASRALGELGLSAAGLRQEIRDRGLFATLQHLTDAFDGQDDATTRVFGNVRALTGIMALMGENAGATEEIFRELAQSTGSLDTAFGVAAETGAFAFEQAKVRIETALLDVGEEILPKLADALEEIGPLLPELIDGLGDLAIMMVDFGVSAVPHVISGLEALQGEILDFQINLLETKKALGGGIGSVADFLLNPLQDNFKGLSRDEAAMLSWLHVKEMLNDRLRAGIEPTKLATLAIGDMAFNADQTAGSLASLQEHLGLTDAQMESAISTIIRNGDAYGLNSTQLAHLVAAGMDYRGSLKTQADATRAAGMEQRTLAIRAGRAARAIADEAVVLGGDVLGALSEFEAGLVAAQEAQESLADAVRAFSDPTFKAVKAMEGLNKANENLASVQEDSDSTAADLASAQLAVVEATLKAQGALDGVTGTAMEAALEAITTALGISDSEARDLLETLGVLDGYEVAAVIEFQTKVTGPMAGAVGSGQFGGTIRGGQFAKFALGGVVPGPIGSPQLAVVHGGEEVLTPEQRFQMPSTTYNQETNRSITVNVVRAEYRDLSGDISEGLIRAGIAEQVDLIGAY